MFSYLRPTGRRVPSNQHDSSLPKNDVEEEQPQTFHAVTNEESLYRPIVSPTAPVLPPIPRVASVYGAPANLPSIAQHERDSDDRRLVQESKETTADIKKARKAISRSVLQRDEASVNSETVAPSPNTRHNFSRPFVATALPSEPTYSKDTQPASSNLLQDIDLAGRRYGSQLQDQVHIPQGRRVSNQRPPSSDEIAKPVLDLNASSRRLEEIQQAPVQNQEQPSATSKVPPLTGDFDPQDAQPKLQRANRSFSNIPSFAGAGMPMLPQQKSLHNIPQEIDSTQISSQQKVPQLISLSNNTDPYQRSSRPMLTRLNPMSLLARRRSSQPASETENDSYRRNIVSGKNLPDDFDPRIRGTRFHDFSEPRSRPAPSPLELQFPTPGKKNSSSIISPEYESDTSGKGPNEVSEPSQRREGERQHTPVFKEHFGDEIDTWRFDENDRRNQSTTGILERVPMDVSEKRRSPLPPFAQKFPEHIRDPLLLSDPTFAVAPRPATPARNVSNTTSVHSPSPPRRSIHERCPSTSPKSVTRSQSRTPSAQDGTTSSTDLPKHLQSNASRFSFDMAGVGSAMQEKLLEDKHRQKIAQKARMSRSSQLSAAATDEDFDFDDFDFDDGLEEEIPGMNEYDEEFAPSDSVANSALVPVTVPDTPPTSNTTGHLYTHVNANLGASSITLKGNDHRDAWAQKSIVLPDENNYGGSSDGDDLYFDDGLIDDIDLQGGEKFDESVFDDESSRVYGRPLSDLGPEPMPAVLEAEGGEESSQQSTRPISLESNLATSQNHVATADTSRTSVQPTEKISAGRRASALRQDLTAQSFNQTVSLTKDNLAAYHDALALATQKAAQEGRFDRKASTDEPGVSEPLNGDAHHVTFEDQPPNSNRGSLGLGISDNVGLDDYELEEDDIVAAANAEALENDEEGFYGSEFGFYARSNDSSEAEFANGGYFGPAGMNDMKRSHSGRINGQEPSLTPITERSEFSQRNSMISLAIHSGHSSFQPPVQTPGLAQIADSIQYEDDSNMSISALMKLRQSAWGGSSSSLHSNGGSMKSGSPPKFNPIMPPPPPPSASPATIPQAHPQQDIHSHANLSKLQNQDLTMSPIFPPTLTSSSDQPISPVRRNAIKGHQGHSSPVKGHSRNSSGADSVTYIKERDEEGSRWVMERRRTGEGGQIEVLGRQVVEGGTI